MKKSITAILATCFIFLFSYCFSFAEGLTLVKSYPADGAKGSEPTNLMIKLEFNKNISDPSAKAQNQKGFSVVDENGKKVKSQVLFNEHSNKKVGILINEILKSNKKYTAVIEGSLKSADGSILGTAKKITFYTRDTSKDSGMGGLMFVAVLAIATLFGVKSAKEKLAAEKKKNESNKKNPYKKDGSKKETQYKHNSAVSKPKKKK